MPLPQRLQPIRHLAAHSITPLTAPRDIGQLAAGHAGRGDPTNDRRECAHNKCIPPNAHMKGAVYSRQSTRPKRSHVNSRTNVIKLIKVATPTAYRLKLKKARRRR